MTARQAEQWLVVLLRIGGTILSTAFLAVFLPVDWMAATHEWLGMGEYPRRPVVEYLARSVAALYGFHGVLLFIVSGDPLRYRTIVWYLAIMNVLFGAAVTVIDWVAGMPAYWTFGEGPPVVAIGIMIGVLNRRLSEDLVRSAATSRS